MGYNRINRVFISNTLLNLFCKEQTMKARLFFLIGIFAFLTAAAFADSSKGITKVSIDEFMAEYAKLEDVVTQINVKQQDISGVWKKDEQKAIKKANKEASKNIKYIEDIKKWTFKVLEKGIETRTFAAKDNRTGGFFLHAYESDDSWVEWVSDGKGNLWIYAKTSTGELTFVEGEKLKEFTDNSWIYLKYTNDALEVPKKEESIMIFGKKSLILKRGLQNSLIIWSYTEMRFSML